MKYLTKEWYKSMQSTDLHLPLKVTGKAGSFSEEFFRKTYEKDEAKWLKLQREVSEVSFEDLYPEEIEFDLDDSMDPADLEAFRVAYQKEREEAEAAFAMQPPFDPEEMRTVFKESFESMLIYLKEMLPEEILEKVADIRLLALNRATGEVKTAIKNWCVANEKTTQDALQAYDKEFSKTFKKSKPAFLEDFGFHDCIITSWEVKGEDLVLALDNSGGFTDITGVTFKNAVILKQEKPLVHAWWLYEEIYRDGSGYKFHVLLDDNSPADLILTAENVEYDRS